MTRGGDDPVDAFAVTVHAAVAHCAGTLDHFSDVEGGFAPTLMRDQIKLVHQK